MPSMLEPPLFRYSKRLQITRIDEMIDQVYDLLLQREAIDIVSAESWQQAWDKHPELRAVEQALLNARERLGDICLCQFCGQQLWPETAADHGELKCKV